MQTAPELQLSSLKVPAPALILFFNRDGCLTAAVPTEQLEAVDENCFPGPSTPTISTFLKAEVDSGVPAIVLLSPLLDVDAVKSNFPGQDEVWDRQLEQFHDLDQTLRQQYPGAVIHHVYLPLGS